MDTLHNPARTLKEGRLNTKLHSVRAILASSVIAVSLAIMLHELAHLLAGSLVGGSPTLLTAIELQGDFSSLTPAGLVVLGASGSVANVLLLVAGTWFLSRRELGPDAALTAWFLFSVNGMLLTTKMIGESVVGFGDWITVVGHLPGSLALRFILLGIGTAGVIWMVRASGGALARLLPPGAQAKRIAAARRIVMIGAGASAVLVLGASLPVPLGTTRTVLLALGAGLAPFVPMFFTPRVVGRALGTGSGEVDSGGWPWLVGAGACTLILWLAFGPGISL
jgi:hypothetical protein